MTEVTAAGRDDLRPMVACLLPSLELLGCRQLGRHQLKLCRFVRHLAFDWRRYCVVFSTDSSVGVSTFLSIFCQRSEFISTALQPTMAAAVADNNFTTVAAFTAIAIVLLSIFPPQKILLFIKSHRARRELRKLCASKDVGDDEDKPRVSGIFIHPIKSMRAVSIPETKFDKHGLPSDRRLMLVRPLPTPLHGSFAKGEATHRFFTQRQAPSLATIEIKPVLSQDQTKILLKLSSKLASPENDHAYIDTHPKTIKNCKVRYLAGLWEDTVEVADVGDDAAEFVANIVGKEDDPSFKDVRVVSILESSMRKVSEKYCPDAARVGFFSELPQGGLTDGFPLLVATETSLELLNEKLKQKGKESLPMSRFRPNIVISNTTKAFDEDNWKAIKVGRGKDAVILHLVKGCPRCKQSCTDQLTGERGEEPVATLSEFRKFGAANEDVYFAVNAVLNGDSYDKAIKVGDPVTILTRGDAVWDLGYVPEE